MTLDLTHLSAQTPWLNPAQYWPSLTRATAHLPTPVATIDLAALRHNAHDLLVRAGGTPIRVATKSIRVRSVIEAILALPGHQGVLAYTLAEALWLAETIDDVVIGYPTADAAGITQLGQSAEFAAKVTLMIDSVAQLDFIDAVLPPAQRETIRVAIELDCSLDHPVLGHLGVWRSPVHTAVQARALAIAIVSRPGFALVGMMGYEAQIAGRGDRPIGKAAEGVLNRWMRRQSIPELTARRAAAVAAVRLVADLEFVNGGGTGSLESTHSDASVTDIAAGSGYFGGHLFDNYSDFRPAPAAAFALSVVRKPTPESATLLGGGWIASGPPGPDRAPSLVWPPELKLKPHEGLGEVQSPLTGPNAAALSVGDRVWLRHTKSGEMSEHVNEFAVVDDGVVVDVVPSYRGEGKAFL
ncbi:alanine racemase [Glaciibacter psychrotolerans]|uniref:D-serine deaminase-like pyridoxal phosphate-dependent protein n=1 Tax=Glaciibacter psychrotolerans TaxID=670054 RepID=A0A7Z0J6E1_9MICO|nr:alanine racemase [Leifsonia psychrotolerans]NYJ19849.1 D-serine deaminase-like pyridoxal phosphate-dependent protein [Leifsonia psychrotolerans]